ncbi:MAG: hypothetical protein H6850_03695 [Alphaproteobacteria bacterium]|nr:MAG: hypothetical protein H6850_03695 [Alphaproteobacteria bacterium]
MLQKLLAYLSTKHNRKIHTLLLSHSKDTKHYWSIGHHEIPAKDLLRFYQDKPEAWDLYATTDKTFEITHLHLSNEYKLLIVMQPSSDLDFAPAFHELKTYATLEFKIDILDDLMDTSKRILRNFIFDKYLFDLFLQDDFFLLDNGQNFYSHTSFIPEAELNSAKVRDFFGIPEQHSDTFSAEALIAEKKFKIESSKFMEIVDADNTYCVTAYIITPLTVKENSIFENYRFLNQISLPIAIFDPKSRIQFKNKAWIEFFEDDAVLNFIKPINAKCFKDREKIYDESIVKGHFIKWYFDPILVSKSPYTLVTAIDSTHNKKEKIDTLKTVERLKQSNQDLERFAHICGHDLKEPLRTISSFSQLLKMRRKDLDETSQNYLDLIIKNAHYMKNLIEDLLRYSEFELHSQNAQEISTHEILQDVFHILSSKIKEKRAIIKVQDNLPETIFCNKTQIMQLFQNLIGNGLKFNNKKVPIINIGYIYNENVDRFFIKDNGMGIHKDYIHELFSMFKRLHNKNDFQGSGIGLAMCKKIIENHNGKIWIESELSQGTTVYFEFPKHTRGRYKCAG